VDQIPNYESWIYESWITTKRLQAHGVILAFCLWSIYAWNMNAPGLQDRFGNLKGADFLHLYTLGSLAGEHRGAELYNARAQSSLAAAHVPQSIGIQFLPLYPPQVAIFFAPFPRFSYPWALVLWLGLSALLYFACCLAIWRACPNLAAGKCSVLILALAFPAFWHLMLWGQTSALALVCFTAGFLALSARQEFLCGLVLGCLAFKPQLGVAAALVFLMSRRWRILAGASISAAAQFAVAAFYFGPGSLRAWLHALSHASRTMSQLEPRPYQTHSLRTFWSMLIPFPRISLALYVASAIAVSALTVICWRSHLSLTLRYSALLLASVLLAPHLTVYDLVIIAPAFLLLSDWLVAQPSRVTRGFKLLLYAAFFLPLLGPLARWTHLQLSVPVFAVLLFSIWRIAQFARDSERV
jgi:hypothetical protein